ncbi:MAG: hypothetical protein RL414_1254 [Actinomycetota bacterium]|jgi:hypothetical protein
MSEIDPLIKREMQWMALGVYENRDLAPIIIAKVRRQRIRRALLSVVGVFVIATASIGIYEGLLRADPVSTVGGVTGNNSATQPEIFGLTSDYPVTWEQSVGDVAAISSAGGLGDTLGGLTAVGLKISWERCERLQCPMTWILSVVNKTNDVVSTSPSLGIFNNHTPLVSESRPTTVLPGGNALLVYTFPEFKETLRISPNATWQWNWYLAQLR